ncbi:hypothetical protein DSECCO2_554950 [anaerobic digester metagenome]
MRSPSYKDTALSMACSSSLTFPGQLYSMKISITSLEIPLKNLLHLSLYFFMKCSTSMGMSSFLLHKSGITSVITLSLKNKSCLSCLLSTTSFISVFIAEITLTSTSTVLLEPTLRTLPSCRTLKSFV